MTFDMTLDRSVPLLLEWYRLFHRDLPWRKDKDPYHVWISEIMLQQTRVEYVKDYYVRFLKKFPSVEALAAADLEEIYKAWQGLGYYTRAANLHKAAKIITDMGRFPDTWEGVRSLPGVGDYTAGAILSIAYDLPYPAVDGNVLRILARLLCDGSDIGDTKTKRLFSDRLKEVYPKEAGDYCQALMELGAIVCLPNGVPLCGQCPWNEICRAHLAGRETEFPVRKPKKERRVEEYAVFVYRFGEEYALVKRKGTGLLSGLWQFPMAEPSENPRGAVVETKRAKHIFTHIEWHMTGYLCEASERFAEYVWATAEEIADNYALPSAFRVFMPWLK